MVGPGGPAAWPRPQSCQVGAHTRSWLQHPRGAVPSRPTSGECGQGSAAPAMLGIKERTRGTSGSGAWRQPPRSCLGAKVLAGQTGLHLKHRGGEAWELPGPPAQQSPSDAALGFLSSILVASVSLTPPLCLAGHLLPLPHPPRGLLGWPSAAAGCPPRAVCAALSPSHQLPATPQTGRGGGNGRMKSTGDRAEVGRAGRRSSPSPSPRSHRELTAAPCTHGSALHRGHPAVSSPDPRHIMTQGCGRKRESHSSETELSELGARGWGRGAGRPRSAAGCWAWGAGRAGLEQSMETSGVKCSLYFWFPQVLEPLPRQGQW